MKNISMQAGAALLATLILAGCASSPCARKDDLYLHSHQAPPLVIPPNANTPAFDNSMDIPELPEGKDKASANDCLITPPPFKEPKPGEEEAE